MENNAFMSEDPSSAPPTRSWLERISQTLLGEPKDRQQLVELLRDAEQREVLDPGALNMIEGVLQVSEMRVNEIMIPRSKMVIIEREKSLEEILPIVIESAHSRFPVIGESRDEVVGLLLAKDLLSYGFNKTQERFNLRNLLRPAVFVPQTKRLDILLNEFRKNRNHLAMVVDEYGGVTGLVTIEDVIEQIVGDIEDEHDIDEDHMIRKHGDNQYSIKAITPIEEFNAYFNTQLSDKEFDTIGGLVLQAFGHLPKRGEHITLAGIPFTVQKATHRRILLLGTHFTPLKDPYR